MVCHFLTLIIIEVVYGGASGRNKQELVILVFLKYRLVCVFLYFELILNYLKVSNFGFTKAKRNKDPERGDPRFKNQ